MMDFLFQAWIVITGATSIWLISNPYSPYYRLGCWIGLAGQPAWFFSTYQNFQWGMFLLSIAFTGSYIRGLTRTRRMFPS
jgi:hypothetical protein